MQERLWAFFRGFSRGLIVIATGGSGGHIFPAEATACKLAELGEYDILLTCDKRAFSFISCFGGATNISPYVVHASPVSGKERYDRVLSLLRNGLGVLQMLIYFLGRRPSVVIGFGSYASLPVLAAARILRIPTMLHEQNAVLGRANRFALPGAKRLALSFDRMLTAAGEVENGLSEKSRYIGHPLREDFIAMHASEAYVPSEAQGEFRILITGGSQGARFFGETLPRALSLLPEDKRARLRIIQQVRGEQIQATQETYDSHDIYASLSPFLHRMPQLLRASHLFIGRCGAATIAELEAIGRASILVPLPGSVDNHQHANALALVEAGGAWMISQDEATAELLAARIGELMDSPAQLAGAAAQAAGLHSGDATARLCDMALALIGGVAESPQAVENPEVIESAEA